MAVTRVRRMSITVPNTLEFDELLYLLRARGTSLSEVLRCLLAALAAAWGLPGDAYLLRGDDCDAALAALRAAVEEALGRRTGGGGR